MKHFWALPVFLRLAVARQHHFNVFDDLLAYPQYEISFVDNVVSEDFAASRLQAASRASSSTATEPHPTPIVDLVQAPTNEQSRKVEEEFGIPEDVVAYELMVKKGQRYLCGIPRIPPEELEPISNHTKEEEEKELARATERGWQLLKGMEGTCVYFISGWWSYSFCFNDGVRQFHQLPPGRNVPAYPPVEDKNVASYTLGRFDKPERKKLGGRKDKQEVAGTSVALPKLRTKGELRYLVQDLKGGTECDLTGKERRIEVQFHCEATASDRISMIKETATCQYLMVISTPRLCNDVAFLPPQQEVPHKIDCTRILPAASIPSFLAEKEYAAAEAKKEELKAELEADKILDKLLQGLMTDEVTFTEEELVDNFPALGLPDALKIGDIVVGGHKVVPPGKTIEKSAVVGGGKEILIATIARSNGFVASEDDLKRLNIKNARQELEGIKAELEKVAAGAPWRLDVVETFRGRELRGIIETDEGNDKDKTNPFEVHRDEGQREVGSTFDKEAPATGPDPGEGGLDRTPADEDDGGKEEEGSEETYKEEL